MSKSSTKSKAKSKAKFRSDLSPDAVRALLGGPRSVALMRALGLLTEKGGASPNSHRKLKQLTHFLRLIEPGLQDVIARYPDPVVVDGAAGKAYLGVVVAEWALRPAEKGKVMGVESRPELVEKVSQVARDMGLPVEMQGGSVIDAELPERVHFTLALHACDTATDEAIVRGVRAKSDYIAVVPCCQAEVYNQLADAPRDGAVSPLWGNAWHRREFGAHLTNVIRALALKAHGYQVTVTELAGWEHSLKNELILARRVGRYHEGAKAELDALLQTIPVRPWLLDALEADAAAAAAVEAAAVAQAAKEALKDAEAAAALAAGAVNGTETGNP